MATLGNGDLFPELRNPPVTRVINEPVLAAGAGWTSRGDRVWHRFGALCTGGSDGRSPRDGELGRAGLGRSKPGGPRVRLLCKDGTSRPTPLRRWRVGRLGTAPGLSRGTGAPDGGPATNRPTAQSPRTLALRYRSATWCH